MRLSRVVWLVFSLGLTVQCNAENLIIRGTNPGVTGNGSVAGLAGSLDLTTVACPLDSFVTGMQLIHSEVFGPATEIRYVCSDALGKVVATKATDPHFVNPEQGETATLPLADTTNVICPRGSFASGLQAFKPDGGPVIDKVRYTCRTPISGLAGIRGTEQIVVGNGNPVPGFAGTIPFGDPSVDCPKFTFVNGIQAFKLDGFSSIVQIRYSCKGLTTSTGTANLRYLVLLVAYAPPGTDGGKGTSVVEYSAGSSAGTTTSASETFTNGISTSTDVGISVGSTDKDKDSAGVGGGVSFSSETSKTNSSSVEIKKTKSSSIKITGPSADGIDHNRDYIYLWLNPQISLSLTSASAMWSFSGNGTAKIQYVQAGWLSDSCLKNQNQSGCMPAAVQKTLKNAGLTVEDFREIRTHDVLLDNGRLDPDRFVPLNSSFPYEPPSAPAAGKVADTVPTSTFAQTDESASITGHSKKYTYKTETTFSGSADFLKIVNVSVKNTNTWEYTNETSEAHSSGSTQTASVTVGGPGVGYSGPTMMGIYVDIIYNTFAFVPMDGAQDAPHGTLVDKEGKPIANSPVFLMAKGTMHRTVSDTRGHWRLPQKISGQCAVESKLISSRIIPECSQPESIELRQ